MIWGSLFLGYFSNYVNYLGGTFGFYLNEGLEDDWDDEKQTRDKF